MKKLRKVMAVLLTTLLFMTMTSVAHLGYAVDQSTVDKLFSVFDDGSNPMYSNPPTGKSLTLKNFAQLAQYAGLGYNHGMKGPIIITEGTLKVDGKSCDIYLVTLTGLEVPTLTPQTTDIITTGQAGLELSNDFEKNVRNAMKKAVPKGANVVLAGHSLVMFNGQIEGTLKRMGDVNDPVPYLSANTFTNWEVQNGTLQKEDSGLGIDITFAAHRNSYFSEKTWGKYDVLGFKGGNATIKLKLKTQKFYASQYMFIDELIGNFA